MSKLPSNEHNSITHDKVTEKIYISIKEIVEKSRENVYRAVNIGMVDAYWNIGKIIVEFEQQGENRAEYGKKLIQILSIKLNKKFGSGFSAPALWNMRKFYQKFSPHCGENYHGHITKRCYGWTNPKRAFGI